mmetsp:Transcript_137345/g.274059  ORF Transcript_137345/g.274059 Transcript_137345/m.274059 type:complete len:100 (+) Transcript_137345:143-442(+)
MASARCIFLAKPPVELKDKINPDANSANKECNQRLQSRTLLDLHSKQTPSDRQQNPAGHTIAPGEREEQRQVTVAGLVSPMEHVVAGVPSLMKSCGVAT